MKRWMSLKVNQCKIVDEKVKGQHNGKFYNYLQTMIGYALNIHFDMNMPEYAQFIHWKHYENYG